MIIKSWVKFDGMELSCICDEDQKCADSDDCSKYVVKFIPIEEYDDPKSVVQKRIDTAVSSLDKVNKEIAKLTRNLRIH